MKIKPIFAVLPVIAIVLIYAAHLAAADRSKADTGDIQWYSYENGMKKLEESGKKGYLHFYTDWCSYCRLMDEKTFSNAGVADYLNANFIAMRINAEKETEVARSYRARQFPLNWFIDANAEPIGSQPGYIPPEQMVYMLKYVKTGDYQKMKFSEFMENQEK